MDIFLHGFETQESDSGSPRFTATIDTGVIYLTGTAPARVKALWPANQLNVANGYNDFPKGLGSTGTLPDALNNVFNQAGRMSQTVVFNIVEEGNTFADTLRAVLGTNAAKTGLYAIARSKPIFNLGPKLLGATGFTSFRPTDGIRDPVVEEGGSNYTTPPDVLVVNGAGDSTGYGATAACTINESGEVDEVVMLTPGLGYTEDVTFQFSGGGGTGAQASATIGNVGSPVASVLTQLGRRYRACAAVSGPNTTNEAAVQYRLDFDSDRLYVLDPYGKFNKGGVAVSMPAESAMLGLQARIDYEEGFWVSPSNHVLEGLLGTARPVEHSYDRSSESQYLNRNNVGTLVRSSTGGWKLFGNRVAASDPLHQFWAVRRAHDTIIESVEIACEPYLDKPFSLQNLVDIAETVNRALRRWTALGATLGGRVWLDAKLNTAESLSSGIVYVSYDAEGPAPMEHIVFIFNRNTGYYDTVFASAALEIARSTSASIAA